MIYTRKPDGSDLQSYQDTIPVFSVAFPPAGILASREGDWLVKIWNPESGDAPLLLQGHGTSVDSVAFLSDDQLVSDSEDK
jgi:WD40 repeat protein